MGRLLHWIPCPGDHNPVPNDAPIPPFLAQSGMNVTTWKQYLEEVEQARSSLYPKTCFCVTCIVITAGVATICYCAQLCMAESKKKAALAKLDAKYFRPIGSSACAHHQIERGNGGLYFWDGPGGTWLHNPQAHMDAMVQTAPSATHNMQ